MNRRQKIIVSVVGIFIVLLALVGLTYAYFLTRINGNKNDKSITLTTAFLSLTYKDDSADLISSDSVIYPSFKDSKTFTVTNDGNEDIDAYSVVLEDYAILYANDDATNNVKAGDVATLDKPEDFEINMTCTAYKNYGKEGQTTVSDGCTGITNGHLPNTNDILVTNSIAEGVTHVYKLDFEFVETGLNQEKDMNKRIEGKINIIDPVNTVMITGTVEATDVHSVEISSEDPKVSYVLNGKYKVFGMAPDNHTMKMFNKAESLLATKTFSIVKGEKAGISGTTITIDGSTEEVIIGVNSSKGLEIVSVVSGNPYESGTLANAIYASAKNKKNGTRFSTEGRTGVSLYHTGTYRDVSLSYFYGNKGDKHLFYNTEQELNDNIYANYYYYDWGREEENEYYHSRVGIYGTCDDSVIGKYTAIVSYHGSAIEVFKVAKCDGTDTIVNTDLDFDNSLSTSIDNDGTTYYYRGNVTDNYVSFADMCWKILRIRGDGSIELILDNKSKACSSTSYTQNANITTKSVDAESLDSYLNNENLTEVLAFQNSFSSSELSKMQYGNWCFNNSSGFKCNSSDKFSSTKGETDDYGNMSGAENLYVSTITPSYFDHAGAYYGLHWDTFLNISSFQYISSFQSFPNGENYLSGNYLSQNWSSDIDSYRPVIALKSGVERNSGSGLIGDAYTIKMN